MEKRIAKIISYVFHPLLMPTLGLVIVFVANPYLDLIPFQIQLKFFLFCIILTGIIPILIIPYIMEIQWLKKNLVSDSLQWAFVVFIIFIWNFIFTVLAAHALPAVGFTLILYTLVSALLTMVLTMLVLIKWNISYNMAVMGNLVGLILIFIKYLESELFFTLITVLLVTGLIGFSRLKMDFNTPAQIYTGFLLGLFSTIVLFFSF